jgi:hypothetical protein
MYSYEPKRETIYPNNKWLNVFIFLMLVFVPGCGSNGDDSRITYDVTAIGIIKKQGLTTYMYGTHILEDDNGKTLYALKSDSIKLRDDIKTGGVQNTRISSGETCVLLERCPA